MTLVDRISWNKKASCSSGLHFHPVLEPSLFHFCEWKLFRCRLYHPQDLFGNCSMLGLHHWSGEHQRLAIQMEHRDPTRSERSNAGGTSFQTYCDAMRT